MIQPAVIHIVRSTTDILVDDFRDGRCFVQQHRSEATDRRFLHCNARRKEAERARIRFVSCASLPLPNRRRKVRRSRANRAESAKGKGAGRGGGGGRRVIAPLPGREIRSAVEKRTLSTINHASVGRAFYHNVIIIIAATLYLEGVSRGKQIGHDHYRPSRSLGSRASWLLTAAAAAAREHPCLLYGLHTRAKAVRRVPHPLAQASEKTSVLYMRD